MRISDRTTRISLWAVILLICGVGRVYADELSFTAQAPQAVVVGDRFNISYVVNTRNVKDFRPPQMDGLSVLSGPNTSTSSSITVVNGRTTQNTTIKFTFTVVANEEGTIEIGPAGITAEKEKMVSNSLTIKVLPPDQNTQNSNPGAGQGSGRSGGQSQSGTVSADDLFMLASVDRTNVYEQEALLLTYKVYVAPSIELTSLTTKMPDLKNFHVQEVELPQQKEFQLEHYNGRNYRSLVWSQYVLFPQHSGELEIPSNTFEGVIQQPVESNDMFDFFFNAGRYVQMKKDLVTRSIKVNVKPLPQGKTQSFYGGVGDFSISSTISSTEVSANDAITLRVVLSGTGNLKLVKTPEVKFPQDFDIYDPKIENKYNIKGGRQTGNKVFEYLVIPRHAGQFTIPPVEFQYFDTKTSEYRTIQTEAYNIEVAKGQGGEQSQVAAGSYVNKEELKYVGQDVRFHATPARLQAQDDMFLDSLPFWLCIIVPVIILAGLVLMRSKRAGDKANQAGVRIKKAGSVASKRLKKAGKFMKAGEKDQFYDEMMRAMNGYLGDRLSISVSDLSKDNIRETLMKRGAGEDLVSMILRLMDDCEFARFAPGDDTGRMDRLFEEASETIGRIENSIK